MLEEPSSLDWGEVARICGLLDASAIGAGASKSAVHTCGTERSIDVHKRKNMATNRYIRFYSNSEVNRPPAEAFCLNRSSALQDQNRNFSAACITLGGAALTTCPNKGVVMPPSTAVGPK